VAIEAEKGTDTKVVRLKPKPSMDKRDDRQIIPEGVHGAGPINFLWGAKIADIRT
jgi:hypothetical protein